MHRLDNICCYCLFIYDFFFGSVWFRLNFYIRVHSFHCCCSSSSRNGDGGGTSSNNNNSWTFAKCLVDALLKCPWMFYVSELLFLSFFFIGPEVCILTLREYISMCVAQRHRHTHAHTSFTHSSTIFEHKFLAAVFFIENIVHTTTHMQ